MKSLLPIRKGEGLPVGLLMLYLIIVNFGSASGLAISTSLLLDQVGARALPYVFVAISLFGMLAGSFYPVIVNRLGNRRFYQFFLWFSFAILLFSNLLLRSEISIVGHNPGVFLQYMAFFVLLMVEIIHFHNYSREFFNPIQFKRVYGFILGATKFGGIAGGLSLGPLLTSYSSADVLWIWILSNLAGAIVLKVLEARSSPAQKARRRASVSLADGISQGIQGISRSPFLKLFSVLLFLDILIGSLMVYQFNEGLAHSFAGEPEAMGIFLGKFVCIANLVALFLQLVVAPYLFTNFSVSNVALIFPAFSLIVLLISIGVWELPTVALLMFHKDYFASAVHLPNRSLFLNALPPERRGFFLGFLEGFASQFFHLLVGIALILVVSFGPDLPAFSNLFSSGFATSFASLAAFLSLAYLLLLRFRFKSLHERELTELLKRRDVRALRNEFQLSTQEFSHFESSDLIEFFPVKNKELVRSQLQQAKRAWCVEFMILHPHCYREWTLGLSNQQRWDHFQWNSNNKSQDYFKMEMSDQELVDVFEAVHKKAKLVGDFYYYVCLYHKRSVLIQLGSKLMSTTPKGFEDLLRTLALFQISCGETLSRGFLKKVFLQPVKIQRLMLQVLKWSSYSKLIIDLAPYFEIASPSIRRLVVELCVNQIHRHGDFDLLIETYRKRSWSLPALRTWIELFLELDSQQKDSLLPELMSEFQKRLVRCTHRLFILKEAGLNDALVESLEQAQEHYLRLILLLYRDSFSPGTLEILERGLFSRQESIRYEALELLSATSKRQLCELIQPFLEFQEPSEILENLKNLPVQSPEVSLEEVLAAFLEEEDDFFRACAINTIAKSQLIGFHDTVEALSHRSGDFYSQEMALDCLGKLVPSSESC